MGKPTDPPPGLGKRTLRSRPCVTFLTPGYVFKSAKSKTTQIVEWYDSRLAFARLRFEPLSGLFFFFFFFFPPVTNRYTVFTGRSVRNAAADVVRRIRTADSFCHVRTLVALRHCLVQVAD